MYNMTKLHTRESPRSFFLWTIFIPTCGCVRLADLFFSTSGSHGCRVEDESCLVVSCEKIVSRGDSGREERRETLFHLSLSYHSPCHPVFLLCPPGGESGPKNLILPRKFATGGIKR